MSIIRNPETYKILPSINLVEPSKDFRITHLGFYDPLYGVDTEPTYKSGRLDNYDDSHLEGKSCVMLYIRHRYFGMGTWKWMSKGHYHTKCFVPNNDMSIWECSHTNKKGDMFLFANLCDDMPISINNDEYKLYVIEPMLTPSEIGALHLKTENVFKWKVKLDKHAKEVARAQSNEVIAISMMTEAVVAKSIYADHIQNLRKMLNVAQDKLLQLTGDKYNVILGAIDKVEMEFDIGVLGNEEMSSRISSMLRKQNIELKTTEAMAALDGDTSDSMKKYMFDTCLRFIGLEKMRQFLNITESGTNRAALLSPSIATVKSLERINMKNLTEQERSDVGKRAVNYIKSLDFLKSQRDDMSDDELADTINSAIESKMISLAEGDVNLMENVHQNGR